MRFIPDAAVRAAEAMLARYADGKYRTPKWRTLPAEQHAAALLRHLAGFHGALADDESGESHAVHLVARAAFLLAQEQTEGREPPDPLAASIAFADQSARLLLPLDDDSPWNPYRQIAGELLSISARLRRLHVARRAAQDGGIAWFCGDTE